MGINPAGSDHQVVAMDYIHSQEVHRYRWNDAGTSFGWLDMLSTEKGNQNADIPNISIEKHKFPTANTIGIAGTAVRIWGAPTRSTAAWSPMRWLSRRGPTCGRSAGVTSTAPYKEPYSGVGSIIVTQSSKTVTGSGTGWKTANRGRGDVLIVGGNTYVIASVDSEHIADPDRTRQPPMFVYRAYTIARQFARLQDWEDCISYKDPVLFPCTYFPVASASLVADNRTEIGVAYEDTVFQHSNGGPSGAALPTGAPVLSIDGPPGNTDASHTITLTADGTNRHYGIPEMGVS